MIESDLKEQVSVRTKAAFKELIMDGRRAVGLKYADEEGNLHSLRGNVVLAAGGYANDHADRSLLDRFAPDLAKLPTTNGPFATGDVIKALLSQDISAQTTLMDKVQIHPTGFIEVKQPNFHTKFLAPEALR
ncbi:osm1, partial [Symbiodinium pilosum]